MKNKKLKQDIGSLAQVILAIGAVTFSILGIYIKGFLIVSESLIGLLLLVMAYNNELSYKRKGLTYAYALVGIILVVCSILGI